MFETSANTVLTHLDFNAPISSSSEWPRGDSGQYILEDVTASAAHHSHSSKQFRRLSSEWVAWETLVWI